MITHQQIVAGAIGLSDLDAAGCYLLHFNAPYRHARHYLGWSHCIGERLTLHAQGKGANLTRVVRDAGIEWDIAALWPGASRNDERRMKNWHKSAQLCPICKAAKAGPRV